MERLDKVISNQIGYSRKEVKDLVKQKRITINGDIALKSDVKVDVLVDKFFVDGEEISGAGLNPSGNISKVPFIYQPSSVKIILFILFKSNKDNCLSWLEEKLLTPTQRPLI